MDKLIKLALEYAQLHKEIMQECNGINPDETEYRSRLIAKMETKKNADRVQATL